MIRGIYSSASGMIAETLRNDTIANNLANANTVGYKKDIAISQDFPSMLIQRINDGPQAPTIGRLGTGATVSEVATIHTPGMMRTTGNSLDVAIEGKGYFTVETPNGLRYTRNGTFTRSSQGELVNADGFRVLGENGPILIEDGKVTIAEDGRVQIDGNDIDRMRVVSFVDEKRLIKEGSSLMIAPNNLETEPATGLLRQGMLEMSNINIVSEMVNMISGYRAYEVNAKVVQAHDQLLDKAVNDVGRI